MEKTLPVAEIFGPTLQGEGLDIGRQAIFIRTIGCDNRCAWCDTSWNRENLIAPHQRMTADEICEEVKRLKPPTLPKSLVVITGGNPLLHNMYILVRKLKKDYEVAIETQGTIYSAWVCYVDHLVVSPKPPSSGNALSAEKLEEFLQIPLRIDSLRVSLKIVVDDVTDFTYAAHIHSKFPEVPLILQPCNKDSKSCDDTHEPSNILNKLNWLKETTENSYNMHDVRILPQLHVLLWGNKRGV